MALAMAGLALLALAIATWHAWPYIQFRWRFEPIGPNAQGYDEYRHRATGIVMVRLPGGTFWMGAQRDGPGRPNYDPHAEPCESPVHQVTLSPFLIAKLETSVTEWTRATGVPARGAASEDRQPAQYLLWEESDGFCRDVGLRLPTEAQWEYGKRRDGTEGGYAGTGVLDEMGWYRDNCQRKRQPVGERRANAFGLHDMHGGAEEWCQDTYDDRFYASAAARGRDPFCATDSGYRVSRGGSWRVRAEECRSATRQKRRVGPQNCGPGFRAAYYPLPK